MRNIDEILRSGWYRDRRGRYWLQCQISDCAFGGWWGYGGPVETGRHTTEDAIRLMIQREQHRAACSGLHLCSHHPMPRVLIRYRWGTDIYFISFGPGCRSGATHDTLAEAMDGGYELAVNP